MGTLPSIDSIQQYSQVLDSIVREVKRKHQEIFHARSAGQKDHFKDTLMLMKSELIQLRQRLGSMDQHYSEKPIGIIDDLCVEIDDLHKNINSLSLTVLSERVDLVKRLVSSLKGFLPTTLLYLDVNEDEILKRTPKDLHEEIKTDFDEIRRCFSVQAYRASIAFCGRILESVLGRRYYDERRKLNPKLTLLDVENELTNLTLGQIIGRCRTVGLLKDQPEVESYADLINKVRILSIHHKQSSFAPGPDAVKGTINFMSEVIRKIYP